MKTADEMVNEIEVKHGVKFYGLERAMIAEAIRSYGEAVREEDAKTERFLDATYTVLVVMGGAGPSMRDNFVANWPECEEYRFCGMWGMSGKIWWNDGKPYVSGEGLEKELRAINRVITDLWKCASAI